MGAIFSGIGAAAFLLYGIYMLRAGFGMMSFVPFLFCLGAAATSVYHFRNSTAQNRYSDFDITDAEEEPDPLDKRYPMSRYNKRKGFCPYCGEAIKAGIGEGFVYCANCGRKL
jgi:hypothetical protein